MYRFAGLLFVLLAGSCGAQMLHLPPLFEDHAVLQRDTPITIWGTANAGADVAVSLAGVEVKTTANDAGEWETHLPAHAAGGPFVLVVRSLGETVEVRDVMLGDVWVASGQSNMHFLMRPALPWTEGVLDDAKEIAAASNEKVRFFTVPVEAAYPEKKEEQGTWEVVSPAAACNLSAVAWYFASMVQQRTGVPIGVISASVDATNITSWMPRSSLGAGTVEAQEKLLQAYAADIAAYEKKLPEYYAASRNALTVCHNVSEAQMHWPMHEYLYGGSGTYNAMIAPLARYAVRGVIWYQGEGDAPNASGYAERMRTMMEAWRTLWHDDVLPFYYVQLANRDFRADQVGKKDARPDNYAQLREEQFKALAVPHTGMAVTADVGDPMLTHPRDKKPVGTRLALQALRNTYGEALVADGPMFMKMEMAGPKLVLHFATEGSGLVNRTGSSEPAGFEIAGDDGVFVPAKATLAGDTVTLSSPGVSQPKHARYAWSNDPRLSLYNRAGLPVSPFVTP